MKRLGFIAILLTGILAASWGIAPTWAQPSGERDSQPKAKPAPTNRALAEFMRHKLTASTKILEGLALEDMELIEQGARELNRMSSAEKWRVSNDVMYQQFSSEFQRNTSELIKAAEEDNLDQSALKWMAATMNCIECHRFVRNTLVVEEK